MPCNRTDGNFGALPVSLCIKDTKKGAIETSYISVVAVLLLKLWKILSAKKSKLDFRKMICLTLPLLILNLSFTGSRRVCSGVWFAYRTPTLSLPSAAMALTACVTSGNLAVNVVQN